MISMNREDIERRFAVQMQVRDIIWLVCDLTGDLE